MSETELLTPEDKIIKEKIAKKIRKYPTKTRKIIKCKYCGKININNFHFCFDIHRYVNSYDDDEYEI